MNDLIRILKGGSGSGNFGHGGRPGKRGGSGKGSRIGRRLETLSSAKNAPATDNLERPNSIDLRKSENYVSSIGSKLSKQFGVSDKDFKTVSVQWANEANGDSFKGMDIQTIASEYFNVPLSSWQSDRMSQLNKSTEFYNKLTEKYKDNPKKLAQWKRSQASHEERLLDNKYTNDDNRKDAIESILSATYKNTQQELKNANITELTLYRGTTQTNGNKGDNVSVEDTNTLESFTTDRNAAKFFADSYGGSVIEVKIPAEKIFSTYATGIGHPLYKEVIIFGGDPVNGTITDKGSKADLKFDLPELEV